jgi:succinyl-diaminopimelate desuccinylase
MQESIITLAKKLIAIPSVSHDTKRLDEVFDLVEKEFAGLPIFIKRFVSNDKPSLVITLTDTKTPDIFLNGHLDVVAATDVSQFRPSMKNNRLYGRGAYDMKATCAVMIQLMKDLAQSDIAKDRVGLMLVPDEEIGGFAGTGFLVKKGYKPKELFLAGEGTNFEIVRESKGALWIKLTAKGKASHGAYPWNGTNATLPIINTLSKLSTLYPTPKDESWKTTYVITKVTGGNAFNIVPEYSEATIDIRFTSEIASTKIIEEIRSILDQEVTLEIVLNQQPHYTHEKNSHLLRLKQLTHDVTGKPTKMAKRHGISDTKFFAGTTIPACSFGPIGANLHETNEYVELESLPQYYQILKRLIAHK